MVRKDIKEKRT